jgi:hypothetical protein
VRVGKNKGQLVFEQKQQLIILYRYLIRHEGFGFLFGKLNFLDADNFCTIKIERA